MKNRFFQKIVQKVMDLSIRKKLLISFFLLIFVPLTLLTFISYINVAKVYEEQVHFTARQSFDQAFTFLNYQFNTLVNSSDMICFDEDIQNIFKKSPQESADIVDQNSDWMQLERILYNLKSYGGVYRATLYVPQWFFYSNQEINFGNLNKFIETPEYEALVKSKDKITWVPPHKIISDNNRDQVSVISFYRKIKDLNQLYVNLSVLRISIPEKEIVNILSKANMSQGGVVYLQDSEGNIVTSSNSANIKAMNLDTAQINALCADEMDWQKVSLSGKDYLMISKNMENTPWTMVAAIPNSEIFSQSDHIRKLMLVLAAILGICSYGLAYFISRSTVNRLMLLNGKMEEVQRGDLDVAIDSRSNDEIGKLMNSFNIMIRRTKALVEQEFKTSKEIKSYELKALQAQINPHFLYNTLDLINWKAMSHDVSGITKIVQALAKFYKLSLNRGRDIVTVEDELNHIKNYVQIQNFRFENRIQLIIDVDPAVYSNKILKIVLQPLVENSIVHGILGKDQDSASGTIRISSRIDQRMLILQVQDDGVGMTPEKARLLLNPESPGQEKGYGILNINMRLKLYYGGEYGLTYTSDEGHGVLVEVRIPYDGI